MGLRNVDLEDASPSPPPPVFTRLHSLHAFPFSRPLPYSKYVDIEGFFESWKKKRKKRNKSRWNECSRKSRKWNHLIFFEISISNQHRSIKSFDRCSLFLSFLFLVEEGSRSKDASARGLIPRLSDSRLIFARGQFRPRPWSRCCRFNNAARHCVSVPIPPHPPSSVRDNWQAVAPFRFARFLLGGRGAARYYPGRPVTHFHRRNEVVGEGDHSEASPPRELFLRWLWNACTHVSPPPLYRADAGDF